MAFKVAPYLLGFDLNQKNLLSDKGRAINSRAHRKYGGRTFHGNAFNFPGSFSHMRNKEFNVSEYLYK